MCDRRNERVSYWQAQVKALDDKTVGARVSHN